MVCLLNKNNIIIILYQSPYTYHLGIWLQLMSIFVPLISYLPKHNCMFLLSDKIKYSLFSTNVNIHLFLAPIPSLSVDNETLVSELTSRFNTPCLPFSNSSKLPAEVILSCSLSDGVEVVYGTVPFMKHVERSSCPLTDSLLSYVRI